MTFSYLRIQEPHLLRLLDSLEEGIIVKDRDGHWLFANDATTQWFDLNKEDFLGKTSIEISQESVKYHQNFPLYSQSDERAWMGGYEDFTHILTDKYGNKHYLHVNKRVISLGDDHEKVLLIVARNITDLRQVEAKRLDSEAKFHTVFDYAGDAMFVSRVRDISNIQFTEVNNIACFHLGYSREELLKMSPFDIVDVDEREMFYRKFTQRLLVEGHLTIETVHLTKVGNRVPVELSIRLFILEGEQFAFTIARDISERKAYESLLYKKAYFDELTELPNSRWLAEQSILANMKIDSKSNPVAIMAVNLDNFRQINDTYGREFGDTVLQMATERLSALLIGTGQLCRWNCEDWVIALTDKEVVANVSKLGEKIRDTLKEPIRIGGRAIFLSASIGIRIYPMHSGESAMTINGLVRQASLVAHEARKLEANKMIEYSWEIESALSRKIEVADGLQYALSRDELYLVYQPKWDSKQQVIGMEALVRWKHPTWGIVSPATFIPIAEESGLIGAVGEYVLRTACRQLKAWTEKGYPCIRVAVNVSVTQLEQPNFLNIVKTILSEAGIEPKQLELEVTESIMMQSKEGLAMLHSLHDYGITLAIDDFGTGYSSLSYLNQLPIHTLKIDQTFVQQLHEEHSDIVVTGIIQLAHNFGLNVVAEGVETEAQLDMLQQRECDAYQGYYFCKPIVADEFEERYLTTRLN